LLFRQFFGKTHRSATVIHTLGPQTTGRQTQHCSTSATVSTVGQKRDGGNPIIWHTYYLAYSRDDAG